MRAAPFIIGASMVICGIAWSRESAIAVPLSVEPADLRTNVFAGREVGVGTVIRGGDAVAGKLVWVLAVANRTLATGAVDVRHAGGGETRADVSVAIPEGREGVVVDAEFAAVLVDAQGTRLGAWSRRVRIFPPDAFAGRMRWLESLEIALIDPEGATDKVLSAAGVPFRLVRSDADLAAERPGLLVVGEGTSWIDHPHLPRVLAHAAVRGTNVLCLAPRDGAMVLPGTADKPGEFVAVRLALRRAEVVVDLDARLDSRDWSASGETVVSRLTVDSDDADVVVRAGGERAGWSWLEAGFARNEAEPAAGTVVVCGLGIVAHWDETPAARYLFASLLERLAPKSAGDAGEKPLITPPASVPLTPDPSKEKER